MRDVHIHIERGPYTLEWIGEFVKTAVRRGLDEIWLLEHSYRFLEFLPMYAEARARSEYISAWLDRKAGVTGLRDYLELAERARRAEFPVEMKFGLEICYFKEHEDLIREHTAGPGLDFFAGSVHFVDGFAFDHRPEHWDGLDADRVYRRYFETAADLAKSRIFDGLAHPDSVKLFGHRPSFSLLPCYEKLAAALAESSMYAEQNGGVSRRTPSSPGMEPELISALKARRVKILTASDAHSPEDVGANIAELEKLI